MAKKIRVWDGTQWQDVAPALPYTAIHSAQASMPSTGVDGQIWLDTDGTLSDTQFVPLAGGTMTGNLNVPSINSGPIVGRNKIINGDFTIWQRGTGSFTTNGAYTADRFAMAFGGTGTAQTVTRESFTAGTAPVAGYEAQYFCRNVVTGGSGTSSLVVLQQKVEDVRTFAGQTVTVSFWAKANTGTPSIGLDLYQDFGSGGSSTVSNGGTKVAITTSWARYSATISIASISGKTIGTGNFLGVRLWFSSGSDYNSLNNSLGIQSATFDVWGVQLEIGNTATVFQTATGTIQGEYDLCCRYYQKLDNPQLRGPATNSTNLARMGMSFKTEMRVAPSISLSGTLYWFDGQSVGTSTTISGAYATTQGLELDLPCTTGTTAASRSIAAYIVAGSGSLGVNAEL